MANQDDAQVSPPEALEGLRVLDMGMNIAGPFCATLLAEFGAEVVKVERPGSGDPLRALGGEQMAKDGVGLFWAQEARNKKCITANLRHPRVKELVLQLAGQCDVVVESFQPGVAERLGFGYDDLRAVRPDVIMVRVSGYGQTGPYSPKPGYARVAQAFGGLTWLAGTPEMPALTPGSTTMTDYITGMFSTIGVLMALEYRRRTGEGQVVDAALYESIFRIMDTLAIQYSVKGLVRGPVGRGTPMASPHSQYPCGDGRWISIACNMDHQWATLARTMGKPVLAEDLRFSTVTARIEHMDEVDAAVTEFTMAHPMKEAWSLLDAAEIPAAPVYPIDGIFEDPQYWARETLVNVMDPVLGQVGLPGVVPRLTRTPGRIKHLGPKDLGSANREVYCGMLGVGEEELASLEAEGAV